MSHPCPGPGEVHVGNGQVDDDMLACSRHWYQVSKSVQSAVYRTWAHGEGQGSMAHLRAMNAAIAQMTPLAPPKARS